MRSASRAWQSGPFAKRNRVKNSVLFIGTGTMGAPMALRLLEAGVPLAAVDFNEGALQVFRDRGIVTARSGAALEGDIVITMLPTDVHVREALLGPGGALTERTREAVIDMSSSAPGATKTLAAELAGRGIAMLDAPVSGGKAGAISGKLTTMVGGDPAVVERYRELLGAMCASVQHVGGIGAGDTMKALNNFLSGVALWATSEALVVGARAGLDVATMIKTWQTSTARNHTVEVKAPKAILPRTFDAGFTTNLIAKDIGIAARLARELDIPAPMLAAAEEHWLTAKYALGPDADFTSVITLIEQWAGFALEPVTMESNK
jgi:3-hydroxyisobutyrate dehydrogenase